MYTLEILQSIAKYLARFQEQVEILNYSGHFSINKISEDILIKLLNETLNLNLINVNYSEKGNYPAIDLIDYDKRVGIQVTSTPKLSKVKRTLESFYTNKIYEKVDKIYIYIITQKLGVYSNQIIQNYKSEFESKHHIKNLEFTNEHILDKRDIFKLLQKNNNIDKLKNVETFLQQNFGELVVHDSLGVYYEHLKNLIYEVPFDDPSGMTLNDIYVDPHYAKYSETSLSKDFFTESSFQNFYIPKTKSLLNDFLFQFLKKSTIENEDFNLLLILGYPGQGKTSCLKKILNTYLLSNHLRDIFFIKLKDIRNGKQLIDNPITLLLDECRRITKIEISHNQFKKSILLLDGLDELFMKDNMTLDDIERICKEISRELLKYTDLKIVITARQGYIDLNKLRREKFQAIQLVPFNLTQQITWLEKFQDFHTVTSLNIQLLNEINKDKSYKFNDIKELLGQPIMLQIIAKLTGNMLVDHINKSEIYDQLFTELIERKYSSDGRLENFSEIEKDDLRSLIQNVAFFIYKNGKGYITKKELLKEEEIILFLKKFPNNDFQNNLKGILISFYFKESGKNQISDDMAIEFLHRSLLEYMTAEYIITRIFENFLDKNTKNNFIINDLEAAWKEINYLFGHQTLSYEVCDYLSDILSRKNIEIKQSFAERLSLFFSELIKKGFLLKYENSDFSPLLISARNFNAYWFFLINCNPNKNFLTDTTSKENVLLYLSLIENNLHLQTVHHSLSNQDFSNSSITNLFFIETEFEKTNLADCELHKVDLFECVIDETIFTNAHIFHCEFNGCVISNINFSGCVLNEISFFSCEFNNVRFKDCYLTSVKFLNSKKMRQSYFNGAIFDKETILFMFENKIKFNYKNCFYSKEYLKDKIPISEKLLKELSIQI